jgi:LacI family transcriptional regulator, galactose operon repressor
VAARLKDIARDLGVSVVTVSKVLRNHEDISAETRERVLKRIEELNYQPNPAAQALVTGKMHLVGLVVPDLVHAFFAQVAKGVSRILREKGYGLVISSSEEDPELERQEIRQMLVRRLDVLMIASTQWTVESFRDIEKQGRRYVLVDRRLLGIAANYVGTDDIAVGSLATSHLIENGCRRVAHLGGRNVSTALDRLQGYRGALLSAGMPVDESLVVSGSHSDDAADVTGYHAMKELLHLKEVPDGVFCYNDPMAMGAMRAILDAGLRIPEDIAIIGAGNVQYASDLRVPLSSVDQDSETLGANSARLALSLMEAKQPPPPQEILIRPKLVPRQSSLRNRPVSSI